MQSTRNWSRSLSLSEDRPTVSGLVMAGLRKEEARKIKRIIEKIFAKLFSRILMELFPF
jgi:hypothetical protein